MRSMRGSVKGRDTLVRGIISKGRFVQGAQHPRTFGRGHTGRGHINPAYYLYLLIYLTYLFFAFRQLCSTFLTWRVANALQRHCTKNLKQIFPEMKLRGQVPNSYILVSVGVYKSLTNA
jgi:hypothetical protein